MAGGLGNQLFQFAASLSGINNQKIFLANTLGSPRNNSTGLPEIFNFTLPDFVDTYQDSKANFLLKKSINYLIRSSSISVKSRLNLIQLRIVKAIFIITYFISKGTVVELILANGLGFSKISKLDSQNQLQIGYFQSHYFADENKATLQSLKLVNPGPELLDLVSVSEIEKPLVVHIRLGDYRNEPHFGILSSNYYQSAVEKLWESGNFHKIWLFSDEIQVVESEYAFFKQYPYRLIGSVDNSASAGLQAMRLGKGYVIANSTYSWWGAYLSYSVNPTVIAPNPWFVALEDPKFLYPALWSVEPR